MIEQPQPHSRSAWSVSVLLHVCLLLLSAIVSVMSPADIPLEEPARPAQIVLKQINSEQQVEYFDEPEATQQPSGVDSPAGPPPTEALPPADQPIDLPPLPKLDHLDPLATGPDVQIEPSPRRTARSLPSGNDQAAIQADLGRQRQQAAAGPTGPSAKVSLFGSTEVEGHRFVFVIDRSKSMGGQGLGVLEAADGQFAAALAGLQENHEFQIIAYNDHLDRYPKKGLTSATPQSKEQALTFVKGLAAFRGTEHGVALLAASYTKADVIFLLTDGGYPEPAAYEMRDILRESTGRTTVHALQFGFGPSQEKTVFMQTLAEKTGGSYSYVDVSKW